MAINEEIALQLGNRVRIRACGILIEDNALLLVNHTGLYDHDFWSPPGGGLEYGEGVAEALVREFREECGLEIEPGSFLFGCSVRKHPLHAVELFFSVRRTGGRVITGTDPERKAGQIISAVEFLEQDRIAGLPERYKHPMLARISDMSELGRISGFFDFT